MAQDTRWMMNKFDPGEMYHMFDMKSQHQDIWYYDNTISYPNEMLKFVEDLDSNPISYMRSSKWEKVNNYQKKVLFKNHMNDTSGDKVVDLKTLYIHNSLWMAREWCYKQFMEQHKLALDKYVVGDDSCCIYKDTHSDMYKTFNIHSGSNWEVIAVTFINDDYEGGEIYFKDYNIKIKPKAGSVLIFPKYLDDKYEILEISSGIRYTSILTIEAKTNMSKPDCYMSV